MTSEGPLGVSIVRVARRPDGSRTRPNARATSANHGPTSASNGAVEPTITKMAVTKATRPRTAETGSSAHPPVVVWVLEGMVVDGGVISGTVVSAFDGARVMVGVSAVIVVDGATAVAAGENCRRRSARSYSATATTTASAWPAMGGSCSPTARR